MCVTGQAYDRGSRYVSSSFLIKYESCKVSKVLPVTWDHWDEPLVQKASPQADVFKRKCLCSKPHLLEGRSGDCLPLFNWDFTL